MGAMTLNPFVFPPGCNTENLGSGNVGNGYDRSAGKPEIFCHVRRIRSSIPLRPTFEDDEAWYCGTAIAVPYVKLHRVFDVTGSLLRFFFEMLKPRQLLLAGSLFQRIWPFPVMTYL